MAQKRMFNKEITNSDEFLDMPISSQILYFHLSMNADDDGFINNWKSIMRMTGTKEDDLKILIIKKFIIPFDSGVVVIRHWRINNYLQKDRIHPTNFQKELSKLEIDKNNVYNLYTNCIPSIDKNSIDKNSIDKNSIDIYSPVKQDKIPYKEIVDYLNLKINRNFKYNTKKTKSLIKARFKENFTLEDFKNVIDKKSKEWLKDRKMSIFLRPETLFGNKFESYLNQPEIIKTTNDISFEELEELKNEQSGIYQSNENTVDELW